MMRSRRGFLTLLATSGVPLVVFEWAEQAGARQSRPGQKPGQRDEDSEPPKIDSKTVLEANQKDIRKSIERLFQLASELKTEVAKTDSVLVLSVAMLKKTEEIEKLAKEIRSRAIG